jgi:hypothetical protein
MPTHGSNFNNKGLSKPTANPKAFQKLFRYLVRPLGREPSLALFFLVLIFIPKIPKSLL